ncbi:RNA polymerase sigma factor [Neptunicella marina]|uniref:Sigma-70 family RNA polymerase sigma factor n=1 Tax=Neptunicella marina TaxID=2125989 RepID=A0A8J6M1N0_9ALTE|nr:sigma-70 family RNA polymerase sigma factor [Neptunicella marina]MBC3765577.1 sigma-70 family RNA polymerase sigma factor [Neptunicella marina]
MHNNNQPDSLTQSISDDGYKELFSSSHWKLKKALSRFLSPSDAEEVIQESFVTLLEQCKQQKPDNPQAFVFRVARNIAISRLRNQAVRRRFLDKEINQIDVIEPQENLQDSMADDQHKAKLLAAIDQLPPVCRQVFVLKKIHGYSHKEIAEQMQISVKTVENHLAKGMKACLFAFRPAASDTSLNRMKADK